MNIPFKFNEKFIKDDGSKKMDATSYRRLICNIKYIFTSTPYNMYIFMRYFKNKAFRILFCINILVKINSSLNK